MNIKDHILFEDNHVLVVYKTAGTAVQTRKIGQKDLESIVKTYLHASGRDPYVGIVQRLDQPVEGVMVLAKTPFAAKELSRQINNRKMEKYYLAVSESNPPDQYGKLMDYLLKNGKTNISEVVDKERKDAKKAELVYKVLKKLPKGILTEIDLMTGRHHQIRVQTAYHGFPLLGDTKYNPAYEENKPEGSLALCAYRLLFLHPKTKKKMEFKIDPKGYYFNS